jgi:hypothetical protein
MKNRFAMLAVLALPCLLAACAEPVQDSLWPLTTRTEGRTILGVPIYPKWIFQRPEHYQFLPLKSNWDSQHMHPAQWDGQDWDPSMWNADWTPEVTLQRLFEARIFHTQYMAGNANAPVPVLELGPKFYKISDLDQRRALKLLADTSGVFAAGHKAIYLRDWKTKEDIGNYSEKGMFLK